MHRLGKRNRVSLYLIPGPHLICVLIICHITSWSWRSVGPSFMLHFAHDASVLWILFRCVSFLPLLSAISFHWFSPLVLCTKKDLVKKAGYAFQPMPHSFLQSPITAVIVECRQATKLQWVKLGCELNVYIAQNLVFPRSGSTNHQ